MSTALQSTVRAGARRPRSLRPRPLTWIALVIGIAGTAVSATGSWIPSLWGDEAASVMSAQRSIPSLFAMLGHVDAVHGTYYLGLHFWIDLVGSDPFVMRLPSAFAIGGTAALVTVIAGRLGSRRVAVAAGILTCVLPRLTIAGSEVRSYAFSALVATLLTMLLVELISREPRRRALWIAYSLVLAAGVYVFLYLALLVVVHGVVLLAMRMPRAFTMRWLRFAGIGIALGLPVLIAAVAERGQIAYLGHRPMVTPANVLVAPWFITIPFAALSWVLIVCAGIAWFRGRRRPMPQRDGRMPRLDLLAAAWLLIPAVVLIGGYFLVPVYTPRYLTYCAPAAAILIALGLDWLTGRKAWALLLSLAVVLGVAVPGYLAQRQPYAKNESDWAVISAVVGAHARPGDAVAFDERTRPSRRPRLAMHTYPAGFAGLADVTLDTPYWAGTSWHDTAYSIPKAAELGRLDGVVRLWLVEYSTPEHLDDHELLALEGLGFTTSASYATHRSVIYELVRPAAAAAEPPSP